ncbi:hypothetical protein NLX83_36130 [Allokutzneria sp. A3M-2-11 16]|uniref:hypothetical protein n=1 Tax=Allokutzneria sp. A3M-2-11 16 TaxID=2962043 RepID=UPI0020B708E4|nr:hypothetical protein [Allokutzneria sp. A3M-2-11 16]MCP3804709.1 hypothetical protein [Allokutzneria sp. A3M-2-11 16]
MKGLLSILAAAALLCAGCGGGGAGGRGGEPAAKDLCDVLGKADFPWPGEPTLQRTTDSVGLTCTWSADGYSVDLKQMRDMRMEPLRKAWNLKEPAMSLGGREVFVRKSAFDLQAEEQLAVECRAAMQDGTGLVTLRVRNYDAADLYGDVTKLAEKVAERIPR